MPPLFFKFGKVNTSGSGNDGAWGVAVPLKFSFPFSSTTGRELFNEELRCRETKQQCLHTKPSAANFLGFFSYECQSHLF